MTFDVMMAAERIWNYFMGKGLTACGCAGLIGNLYAESGLRPDNLQGTGNLRLFMSDEQYVKAVDSESYTEEQFANDKLGFGLAQWTWHTRKRALYRFAMFRDSSIGDLDTQIEFLYKELSESYPRVLSVLNSTESIAEASDTVLTEFERPANQSDSVKRKRAEHGQKFFDKLYKESDNMTEIIKDNTPDEWAKEAVDWAVKYKILYGDQNGDYKLRSNCTRQEMLIFLHRVYKLIKGIN